MAVVNTPLKVKFFGFKKRKITEFFIAFSFFSCSCCRSQLYPYSFNEFCLTPCLIKLAHDKYSEKGSSGKKKKYLHRKLLFAFTLYCQFYNAD